MSDVANGEPCTSPLELFNSIAAQGALVKSLKAKKASKVGGFVGLYNTCNLSLPHL
jgi:hypothetical protein